MRGIPFKEDMVIKIINGEKHQTRRIIKNVDSDFKFLSKGINDYATFKHPQTGEVYGMYPSYITGEAYYLKEPYAVVNVLDGYEFTIYQYDHKKPHEYHPDLFEKDIDWKPKFFMPLKMARYFVEIVEVRVQKLTEISDIDVAMEGFKDLEEMQKRWEQINGPDSFWTDPWVFAYTFKLLTKEELLTREDLS